ncbi:MAG: ABC transporter substrate-binding protein [Porticoccaceae bacterium]|jgi:phospholipid transport system substrate-binding protein|nr:ABC transporter substrate-binding protein [Porticoccaceae bacterium]MEA3300683.1 ABC transporter substrate-binding protein [Pseudomonadota bacterium]HLS98702.1 ABC transporter substrate-binding protein [Porticoccaceae bacterium]
MKVPAFITALIASLLLICAPAMANVGAAPAPHALVQDVTDRLLDDIARYRKALAGAASESEKNAMMGRFFDELSATLEPVVDFHWIALNVMGKHRAAATAEQQARFREAFTRGLVETYGRGLLNYSDQKIVVLPPREPLDGQRKVTVVQEIQGADAKYPLLYSMGQNRKGEWKVVNVIINGINLGTTFRNQFAQAFARHNGDIDKVITTWTTTET